MAYVCCFLQYGGFINAAQRMVRKLRLGAFKSLMKQEIGWYDMEENNSGAIAARLAKEVQLISDATGGNLSRMVRRAQGSFEPRESERYGRSV